MNLETKQGGAVDNYHMYVQPRVQVQNTLQQQSADIEQQSTDTLALRHYMSQIELVQHGPVAPTGTGSVFMQYSHYFPNGRALGGSSVIIHHTSMMAMPSLPGMSTLPGMTPPPGATPVMSGNRF
jgi:hypothetical protein